MPGGLIQLVAVGIQDEKLTQDPEITFFKAVYRPYINFALESIEQTFAGNAGFGKRVQSEMSRNGDLVKDALLEVVLPALSITAGAPLVVVPGSPAIQGVTFSTDVALGAATFFTAGHFSLSFNGVDTDDIQFNATTADIQAAVDGVLGVGTTTIALYRADGITDAVELTDGSVLLVNNNENKLMVITWLADGEQPPLRVGHESLSGTTTVDIHVNVVNTGVITPLHTAVTGADSSTTGGSTGTCAWAPVIGHTLLKEMSVEIGGQTIDRHYGRWYDIWMELTQAEEKRKGFNDMIGHQNLTEVLAVADSGVQSVTHQYDGLQTQKTTHASQRLFIPLRFWFNVNPGLALPIIALSYHQIKLLIEFRPSSECLVPGNGATTSDVVLTPSDLTVNLWLDYVFLDNAERRNYAQTPHEYLIDQLQFTGAESITGATPKLRLNFNHPVQELVWVVQEDAAPDVAPLNQHNNYVTVSATGSLGAAATGGLNPLTSAKLQLNGQDRFPVRVGEYFNLVQAYNHHKRVPTSKGVFLYSFSLQPEDYQPNGTANFSRIDTAVLNLTLTNINASNTGKAYVYVRSYNLFRIASGMGGLAYAS
jgi:hypothetical protein